MATQQWLRQLRDEPSRLQIDAAHPQPSVTVFCVPDLVRSMSPAYHQRKELQLGLLQRTMQTTGTQLLKVDIARSLHGKLHSIEGSWEAFAAAVVGDLQTARGHYQSDCSTGLADEVVLYLLALDALFLVVFFQFLNNKDFFLVEFQHLEPRLIDIDCVYVVLCGHSLPVTAPQRSPSPCLDSIPSVSRLRAIGIDITDKAPALNQIKLTGCGYVTSATLSLPKVNIYDFTETVFHNLAVHEQLTGGGDLRCFLQCMASLSNDSADVALLIDHGVVDDKVGTDGVGMWNRIMKGVYTPRPSPSWLQCYQDIHHHRRNRVKRWRREAWVLFFSKPWTFLGLVGALTILFLTAVQTWFTVVNAESRSWHWPKKS